MHPRTDRRVARPGRELLLEGLGPYDIKERGSVKGWWGGWERADLELLTQWNDIIVVRVHLDQVNRQAGAGLEGWVCG